MTIAAIIKPYRVFNFFLEYGYDLRMYIWCKNHFKIPVGKCFLKGVPGTPVCSNGRSEYLMQLTVNT